MTAMTETSAPRLRPEIGEVKTVDGVEMIFEACGRCGGTGSYGPLCVDSGICFGCRVYNPRTRSHYGYGGQWVVKADYDRRARNRELAAARRERKAAEFKAGEAARYEALVAAHPLLAELTYLADYSGILGDMRAQFERKGALSDRQIAVAEKMIREDYQRQAAADARAAKYAAERAARPNAAIGEVGQRREFTGTVRVTREFSKFYGRVERFSTLIIIDTPEGAVKWFASGTFDIQRGETITVKATIKDHEVYTPQGGGEADAQITTVVTKGKIQD